MSGDIQVWHNRGDGHYCHLVSRDRGAAKHPRMHRAVPHSKNYLFPNVKDTKVEKPGHKMMWPPKCESFHLLQRHTN